jgi:hypothetical protein
MEDCNVRFLNTLGLNVPSSEVILKNTDKSFVSVIKLLSAGCKAVLAAGSEDEIQGGGIPKDEIGM